MKLLSWEQRLVAHFILQTNEERARIFAEAQRSRESSGPLIHAYRWAMQL